MLAIRDIVNRDVFKDYEIPEEFGDKFEMILVPIENMNENEHVSAETCNSSVEDKILMKYQEENGFSKHILSQESEDVWNDI